MLEQPLKGCDLLRYYAKAVREQGEDEWNPDGLMIKGAHCEKGDFLIMVYCRPLKRRRGDGRFCDYVIRKTEEVFGKSIYQGKPVSVLARDIYDLYSGKLSGKRRMKQTLVNVFITFGNVYFSIGNTDDGVISITSRNVEAMKPIVKDESGGFFMKSGTLKEEQTILMCSKTFAERLSKDELIKALCPQMQDEEDNLDEAVTSIANNIRGKGERRSLSAAALTIRKS